MTSRPPSSLSRLHSLDAVGRCSPTSESPLPAALLLYGEERSNAALAVELTLDGYEVCRASDPARLRAACAACEVELVIWLVLASPTHCMMHVDSRKQLPKTT
jgi:hypothetical protein